MVLNKAQLTALSKQVGKKMQTGSGIGLSGIVIKVGKPGKFDRAITVLTLEALSLQTKAMNRKLEDGSFEALVVDEVTVDIRPGDVVRVCMKNEPADAAKIGTAGPGTLVRFASIEARNRMEGLRVGGKAVEGGPEVMTFKFEAKGCTINRAVHGSGASFAELAGRYGVGGEPVPPVPRSLMEEGSTVHDATEPTKRPFVLRFGKVAGGSFSYNPAYQTADQRYLTSDKMGPVRTMVSACAVSERDDGGFDLVIMDAYDDVLGTGFPAEQAALHALWQTTMGPTIAASNLVTWVCAPRLDATRAEQGNMAEEGGSVWRTNGHPLFSMQELVRRYGFRVSPHIAAGVFEANRSLGGTSADAAVCLKHTDNAILVNAAPELLRELMRGADGQHELGDSSFWAVLPVSDVGGVSMVPQVERAAAEMRKALEAGTLTPADIFAYLDPEAEDPADPAKADLLLKLDAVRRLGVTPGECAIYWLGDAPADNLLLNVDMMEAARAAPAAGEKRAAEPHPEAPAAKALAE